MRAARARRTSGSRVRGIADKNNKWWDVRVRKPSLNFCRAALDGQPRAAVSTQIVIGRSRHADAAALPQLHYLVEHTVRNFPFRGLGDIEYFALRDDSDGIAVGIKTDAFARNVIDYDCVERLRCQLLASVFQPVLRLGCKAHDDLRSSPACYLGQNICRRFQLQLHLTLPLDLLA